MAAPTVLAIVNHKGGSGKSTTAAYVAHALADKGRTVLVVDADPQASAHTWARAAPWADVGCIAEPHDRLHRVLPGISPTPDVVVIDTPGTEHGRAITLSAVRAATHVIVPCAPTTIEYQRLRALRHLLDEAVRDGCEFEHGVLLVRAVTGAASTEMFRGLMTGDGWRVLHAAVPRLERFAQAFGQPVEGARLTGYGFAVAELTEGIRT